MSRNIFTISVLHRVTEESSLPKVQLLFLLIKVLAARHLLQWCIIMSLFKSEPGTSSAGLHDPVDSSKAMGLSQDALLKVPFSKHT